MTNPSYDNRDCQYFPAFGHLTSLMHCHGVQLALDLLFLRPPSLSADTSGRITSNMTSPCPKLMGLSNGFNERYIRCQAMKYLDGIIERGNVHSVYDVANNA